MTNDFDWVQLTNRNVVLSPSEINPAPPPAEGVRVTWKPGLLTTSVAPPRPHRPYAVEAVSGTELTVHEFDGGYRVDLPTFPFMALLAITQE